MQSVLSKTLVLIAVLLCCFGTSRCTAQDKSKLPPSKNFDLSGWNLSIPTDRDGNGKSDTIDEAHLSQGYQNSEYFYTGSDGGMVFKVPIKGFKTSKNTSNIRVPNYARCCGEAISRFPLEINLAAQIKTTGCCHRLRQSLKNRRERSMESWRPHLP